ncbi:dephospho-CoA kinase [Clostridium botulinum]|uniref:Dephospho-CoA kinase n=1 Tax=Clostridium botulinum (strain Hall / ATCC 3502 / NCTC 13319 / Type A) TaxID=441771 RepID=A5I692_CLOBH|nr:dephospho-CoA kinase [Clostridium botulinum]ABS34093.1 dephospho-CoA kinase [Clostridium botulinum A str. ATCC 19397]ABS37534.1 dephospho-CoA kinase [Clostridium botulinum A str. Hall]APQ96908.1 dephospho-CoA kinase [Clostridium botulinum]AWB18823.1 dephospho-CoA kinase [Clostridium botulinum]AWB31639.1 dephospho-CoA kinase [Clostridium botulinum]
MYCLKSIFKIGLTGGIGAGKSTISEMIKEKNIPVIDADKISREVLKLYPEILIRVKEVFGKEFLDDNGDLKRREFGSYIFKNKNKRMEYENIIMPYITKETFKRIKLLEENKESICVLDAPTLIEQGLYKYMDINILVWVDKDTQINRVVKRDGLNRSEVMNRINSQMSMEEKKKFVEYIIDNSKDIENTKSELDKIFMEVMIKARQKGGVL